MRPPRIATLLRGLDWIMVLATLLLIAGGVAFIYSASYRGDDLPVPPFYRRQIIWAALGLVVFLICAAWDYRRWREAAWWLYFATLLLLVWVLVAGRKMYGATRWLSLFGWHMQPSEFAKVVWILWLARFLSRPGRDTRAPWTTARALLMMAPLFLLIARQPDLGTAAMLIPVTCAMLFVAGTPLKHFVVMALIAILMAPVAWGQLNEYQRNRLRVFLQPDRDPLGAGWNKIQSEIAVGSGRLWGKGFLEGKQNVLGFLPRTVAPTDFIYSVIAEETGFVGSAVLLLLYGVLIARGIRAGLAAPDRNARLIATGVTTLLFSQVFVNIAMTIGLLPITGLPLPLISYGGSSLLATMAGLGILQSIHARRAKT